jgi:hypothetical protein
MAGAGLDDLDGLAVADEERGVEVAERRPGRLMLATVPRRLSVVNEVAPGAAGSLSAPDTGG